MPVRPAPDHAALLELVDEVSGLEGLDEFRHGLLVGLLHAVPAKWASLDEVGPDGVVALVEPPLDSKWVVRLAHLRHQNPLHQRWLRTRDGGAYRLSDVTTRERLEETTLYREVYAALGIQHQIAFALPNGPARVLALALYREDRDFSDTERDLLNRARPFLIQAYRNAVALSEARGQSPEELEAALVSEGLSRREAEVVRLVALGCSNHDVADRLGVTDRTIEKLLERAFRKLGVTSE